MIFWRGGNDREDCPNRSALYCVMQYCAVISSHEHVSTGSLGFRIFCVFFITRASLLVLGLVFCAYLCTVCFVCILVIVSLFGSTSAVDCLAGFRFVS